MNRQTRRRKRKVRTTFQPLIFIFVALIGLPAACVPFQTDSGRVQMALINAPSEDKVKALSGELKAALEAEPALDLYGFSPLNRVRWHEEHRGMVGSRAPLQAAFTARALGAELALMISAPLYERHIEEKRSFLSDVRVIETRVQLELKVIDPKTAAPLATYQSPIFYEKRVESLKRKLDEIENDESLAEARRKALRALLPGLAEDLAFLLRRESISAAAPQGF